MIFFVFQKHFHLFFADRVAVIFVNVDELHQDPFLISIWPFLKQIDQTTELVEHHGAVVKRCRLMSTYLVNEVRSCLVHVPCCVLSCQYSFYFLCVPYAVMVSVIIWILEVVLPARITGLLVLLVLLGLQDFNQKHELVEVEFFVISANLSSLLNNYVPLGLRHFLRRHQHVQEPSHLLVLDEPIFGLGPVLTVDHVEDFLQVVTASFLIFHLLIEVFFKFEALLALP